MRKSPKVALLPGLICMQMKLYFLALFLVEYQMQSMQFQSNVRVYFHVWFHQKKYSFYPIYANFNYLLLFSWHLNWTIWYLWKKNFATMLFLDDFRHIENKHEQVKKGECSRCHRKFGTKSSAERHEREQKCPKKT